MSREVLTDVLIDPLIYSKYFMEKYMIDTFGVDKYISLPNSYWDNLESGWIVFIMNDFCVNVEKPIRQVIKHPGIIYLYGYVEPNCYRYDDYIEKGSEQYPFWNMGYIDYLKYYENI